MSPARLLEHFGRICQAPDAVPRLRRFILDLAVRGKLVEQAPNDEPARELLNRIHARRLEGTGRNAPNPLPSDPEALVPLGWSSTVLANLVAVLNGRAYAKAELLDAGTPVLRVGNLFTSDHWYYSNLALDPAKYCEEGDLLYAWSASFGPYIWRGPKVIFHYHIWKLEPHDPDSINKRYLYYFLVQKTREIKEAGHGVSMLHMTKEKMERVAVPLPPLAEQHRIVAKLDELMDLCDRLEAAQAKREACRDRLVAASLIRLNEPMDGAGTERFREHAHFHLRHLARHSIRSEHVKQLRHTILNLAVRGILTADWREQRAGETDASGVLTKLAAAHESVGGHRKGNAAAATEGAHDLDPAELPVTWRITDLRTAVCPDRPITYGILMPGPDTAGGIPYVRVADFPNDTINLETVRRTTKDIEARYARARLRTGDLLLSIRGTVGRVCVVPSALNGANITQDTARLTIQDAVSRDFVACCLRAPVTQYRMRQCSKGVAVRGINIGDVRALQIPLPSLAEQHQIVARVNELMGLCDRLEAQLAITETESSLLLEAVLHQALTPVA